ncbi:MAG: DUF4430 domain-containing protein [Lachnospiraceae bacterium]
MGHINRIKKSEISEISKRSKIIRCLLLLGICMAITACGTKDQAVTKDETKTATSKEMKSTKDGNLKSQQIPEDLLPTDGGESIEDTTGRKGQSKGQEDIYDVARGQSGTASQTGGQTTDANGSSSTIKDTESSTDHTDKTIQVTISAECANAVNYGLQVPEVCLKKTSVKLTTGQTVYDALSVSGVNFVGSSGYVSGIAGVYEKDCGSKSGWMYLVNGSVGNTGSNRYVCKEGDVIEWRYTTNMGKDL